MKTNQPVKKLGKVYLIGVDHRAQWDRNLSLTMKYISYLKEQAQRVSPDLIAEEFSQEALEQPALKLDNVTSTTTQDVAGQYGIKHEFCDWDGQIKEKLKIPSREKLKKQLGIRGPVFEGSEYDKQIKQEEKKYYHKKEEIWLKVIRDEKASNTIFVCGISHLKSFKVLLENNNYEVKILPERFNMA